MEIQISRFNFSAVVVGSECLEINVYNESSENIKAE